MIVCVMVDASRISNHDLLEKKESKVSMVDLLEKEESNVSVVDATNTGSCCWSQNEHSSCSCNFASTGELCCRDAGRPKGQRIYCAKHHNQPECPPANK